jgi:divalent metal cation (Fe/Co/Zn/Cd) transporter
MCCSFIVSFFLITSGFKIIVTSWESVLAPLGRNTRLIPERKGKSELYLLQFTVLILSQVDEIEFWGDPMTV